MKPMPYEIVPPVEHMNPHGVCFDMYQCPACLEGMQRRDNPKHLSDAECAAEYWKALYARYSAAFMDCDDGIQSPDDEHRQHWHEISTWRKFAEHPHAFGGPDGSTQ